MTSVNDNDKSRTAYIKSMTAIGDSIVLNMNNKFKQFNKYSHDYNETFESMINIYEAQIYKAVATDPFAADIELPTSIMEAENSKYADE